MATRQLDSPSRPETHYADTVIGIRTTRWLVIATLAAIVMPAGGASPAQAAPTEFRPYSWDVEGIGPSGRTLRLQYVSTRDCNGTFLGPQSRVVESAAAVTIELFDVVDLPPPGAPRLSCPLSLGPPRPAYVTLAAPLAGRAIKGRIADPSATVPVGPPAASPVPDGAIRVPRVVGFSVWEARRVIWRSGLNVQIRRSKRSVARTQVVAQGPSGRLRPQQTVALRVAFAR
jgi:hypothetical protein